MLQKRIPLVVGEFLQFHFFSNMFLCFKHPIIPLTRFHFIPPGVPLQRHKLFSAFCCLRSPETCYCKTGMFVFVLMRIKYGFIYRLHITAYVSKLEKGKNKQMMSRENWIFWIVLPVQTDSWSWCPSHRQRSNYLGSPNYSHLSCQGRRSSSWLHRWVCKNNVFYFTDVPQC